MEGQASSVGNTGKAVLCTMYSSAADSASNEFAIFNPTE